jgi:hypothetical protein
MPVWWIRYFVDLPDLIFLSMHKAAGSVARSCNCMPQYEIVSEEGGGAKLIRARNEREALRKVLLCGASDVLALEEMHDLAGWKRVIVNGSERGQIRPHHRMRFRRD